MTDPEDLGGEATRVAVADEQGRPLDTAALVALAEYALEILEVPARHGLSIALVDREAIASLKERYLGERAATDVLSFPMDPLDAPGPAVLGDVVICVEVAERQAHALGRRVDEELGRLLVHGILHLAGRDHSDVATERAMAAEERRVLKGFEAVAS